MRSLDEEKALNALARWVAEITKDAPGLVLGLSGTDSALAFMVCARALALAGKNQNSLVGIHYGESFEFKDWFEQYGAVEVTPLPENKLLEEDVYRWAALQSYAMKRKFWTVGTRNRMEQRLGDYSNASAVAVLQPIAPLWKSEVLSICEYLGVPKKLVDSGWMGDPTCECHRPCILRRLDESEMILSASMGEDDAQSVKKEVFYDEIIGILQNFTKEKAYKSKIPYRPPVNILDGAIIG